MFDYISTHVLYHPFLEFSTLSLRFSTVVIFRIRFYQMVFDLTYTSKIIITGTVKTGQLLLHLTDIKVRSEFL